MDFSKQPATTPAPVADEACPHCGQLDIPHYEDELAICPGCGTVLAEAPPSWLAQWPAPRRSALAQLFYAAIRQGHSDPPAIVDVVVTSIHHSLRWTRDFDKRQWFFQVLNAIQDDPRAAQAYATEVLAVEQLSPQEKAARKAAQAKPYALAAMQGMPVTDKQLWLIRSKGYTGEMPRDRAAASMLIDRLLHAKGAS